MFTFILLLAIVLLLSLWLALRARAASIRRKETAEFTAKMLAQLEQMEADFNAYEREYAEMQRDQRKLEKAQRLKEDRSQPGSTPKRRRPKLKKTPAEHSSESSSLPPSKAEKKAIEHPPSVHLLNHCDNRRDRGRFTAAIFLEPWRARMARLPAILISSFRFLASNWWAFLSRRQPSPPHQSSLPQSRAA